MHNKLFHSIYHSCKTSPPPPTSPPPIESYSHKASCKHSYNSSRLELLARRRIPLSSWGCGRAGRPAGPGVHVPLLAVCDLGAHGSPAPVEGIQLVVEKAGVGRRRRLPHDVTARLVQTADRRLVHPYIPLQLLADGLVWPEDGRRVQGEYTKDNQVNAPLPWVVWIKS